MEASYLNRIFLGFIFCVVLTPRNFGSSERMQARNILVSTTPSLLKCHNITKASKVTSYLPHSNRIGSKLCVLKPSGFRLSPCITVIKTSVFLSADIKQALNLYYFL